jgi:predicted metal-dependent hydrolase
MTEVIRLGDIDIAVTRKLVKHVHLSVHPPAGKVTLVAPAGTRLEVARAYAISKLGWIRRPAGEAAGTGARDPAPVCRAGKPLPLGTALSAVHRREGRQAKREALDHRRIVLSVRPGVGLAKREEVMLEWSRSLLHEAVPALIRKWEQRLGVKASGYFLQRMKTKWGSCNHRAGKHSAEYRAGEEAQGPA